MKCLMKYKWVKLLRCRLPEGKGILGDWARLASRAAYRKGQAFYCGHSNNVCPGMWAGGIVGLKNILGKKSRAQVLETLERLSSFGYIEYSLNAKTKKLSYRISDWVIKCSGKECLGKAVYTTDGYGFICLPRSIPDRLVDRQYKFEESDAWLDLWCHTVFEDPLNAFSFLAPTIQYGKYGAVLTLESLGRRWNWEKTKVHRFFRKHGDAFTIVRLNGSYGCLVFNKMYPAEKTCGYIEAEAARIVDKIRFLAKNTHITGSDHKRLNMFVSMFSRSLTELCGKAKKTVRTKCRVALFDHIIREYISHCRNRKNCTYDCESICNRKSFEADKIQIRGPCVQPDTLKNKNGKDKTMQDEERKSTYEEQENEIRMHSEAFIGLLTKRGILGDRKIDNEQVRAAHQEKLKKAYHNTEMLLKNYRLFIWVITCAPQDIAEELDKQYETVDELLKQLDFELAIGNRKAEMRMENMMSSRVLLKRLDEALTVLKNKPDNGVKLYDLIYLTYIAPEKLSHKELLYRLSLSSRQYYRLRSQAISILAIRLWSSPTSSVDFWLEILTLLDPEE